MGTNYYWTPATQPPCTYCGRPYEVERLHIGKSSYGWCFSLHVTDDIPSLDEWKKLWTTGTITSEYGNEFSSDEMLSEITDRKRSDPPTWTTAQYRDSYAEPGPNNLIRYSIDLDSRRYMRCVGHGDTWDLIAGDFS